ncbi:TonB family protein [Sphingomonas sp. Mn802worker]|uniref:TonB family protein n=1 Tax=Sphingomonas sp. Mn802worker TaxID=629773 RepID=UPI0003A7856F|nr:TonB family protein [Sphingomonas sp. Mn802worker]
MRARLIAGTITPRDYPKQERAARIGGSVTVSFEVGADGRARGCVVTGTSGNTALDTTTCRLVEARFRYAPARSAGGVPVSEQRGWRQRWWLE